MVEYNESEVEAFKQWLREMADADEYELAEFEIADGIVLECDWSTAYEEPDVPVYVCVTGDGFQWFTRSIGKTLADTGSYGHGENHGDELAADIEGWIAHNFTDKFEEIIFGNAQAGDGSVWTFNGWVPNPNYNWEEAPV